MKCKYCGYQDHTFARICPICGEAVEDQTIGIKAPSMPQKEMPAASESMVVPQKNATAPSDPTVEKLEAGAYEEPMIEKTEAPLREKPKVEKAEASAAEALRAEKAEATQQTSNETENVLCPNCGHVDSADTVFCPKCGTRIKAISYCKFCGSQLDGISQYCTNCGRDKDGNVKAKFAGVQELAGKLPELKLDKIEVKDRWNANLIASIIAGLVLLILSLTKWFHVGAISLLNSLGGLFGLDEMLDTDYSVFQIGQLLWRYGDEFGSESIKIKVIGAALMVLGGIAILCALGVIVYAVQRKYEVRDALKHAAWLNLILSVGMFLGALYINAQFSEELHYSGSAIECTGWLYASAVVAVFLLVKGISLIAPEVKYASFDEPAVDEVEPERTETVDARAFAMPAAAESRVNTEFQSVVPDRNVEIASDANHEIEQVHARKKTQEKKHIDSGKAKKIIIVLLIVLLVAGGAWLIVTKLLNNTDDAAGNYFVCGLAPAFDGDLYGYIDEDREFEIEGAFEYAEPFDPSGVACVCVNDKWGLINKKGEFVLKPQFEYDFEFDENGIALVEKNDKYGMINTDGEIVVPCKYGWNDNILEIGSVRELGDFAKNGLTYFYENGKAGYLNTKGEVAIPAQYEQADDFSENGLAMVKSDGKYGYINADGEEVIPCVYDLARPFFKDYPTLVCKNEEYWYIDNTGTEVTETRYSNADDFICGYATVEGENGKWGAIDINGEWVIEPEYDDPFNFSADHFAAVNRDGFSYLIDIEGKQICQLGYENDYSMGDFFLYTMVYNEGIYDSRLPIEAKEELESHEMFPYEMPVPYGVPNGYNWEWNYAYDYQYGYIDMNGEVVINTEYEYTWPFAENGLARVTTGDGKDGFINTSGEFAVEPIYSYTQNGFYDPLVFANRDDGNIDVLDQTGTIIDQIQFKEEEAEDSYVEHDVFDDGFTTIYIYSRSDYSDDKLLREIVYSGTEKVFDSDYIV